VLEKQVGNADEWAEGREECDLQRFDHEAMERPPYPASARGLISFS
jgi:hypothetical protein